MQRQLELKRVEHDRLLTRILTIADLQAAWVLFRYGARPRAAPAAVHASHLPLQYGGLGRPVHSPRGQALSIVGVVALPVIQAPAPEVAACLLERPTSGPCRLRRRSRACRHPPRGAGFPCPTLAKGLAAGRATELMNRPTTCEAGNAELPALVMSTRLRCIFLISPLRLVPCCSPKLNRSPHVPLTSSPLRTTSRSGPRLRPAPHRVHSQPERCCRMSADQRPPAQRASLQRPYVVASRC